MEVIYLDNNATTQPTDAVIQRMHEANQTQWANPSSVHRFGQMVRQQIELARHTTASLINAAPRELTFTSGGTEANNLALRGSGATIILTSPVEHAAITETAEQCPRVVMLPVNRCGLVEPEVLAQALGEHVGPKDKALVSLQWANNETGLIASIEPLVQIAHAHSPHVLFHSDAVQAVGKIPVDVKASKVDMLTLAAHKFHGPKGVGVLYVRRGVGMKPQISGGPQENEKRGGTENVPGILGMGEAANLAKIFLADAAKIQQLHDLRDQFEATLLNALRDTVVNPCGHDADRLWNTTNLGFPKLQAEAILLMLSERGVCASAGAACSSGSLEPSPALLAMGVPAPVAHGSVRFSLSRFSTSQEIKAASGIVIEVITRLQKSYASVL